MFRLWKRSDERALRRELRRRARASRSLRKALRRAHTAPYYRPVVGWLAGLFSGGIQLVLAPVLLFRFLESIPSRVDVVSLAPIILAGFAWWVAWLMVAGIWDGRIGMLQLLYPLLSRDGFRHGLVRALARTWLIGAIVVLAVMCTKWVRVGTELADVTYLLHIPVFVVMAILGVKARRYVPFVFGLLGLLFLFFVHFPRSESFAGAVRLASLLQYLLPAEWVQRVHGAAVAGELRRALLWLLPVLPACGACLWVLRAERTDYLQSFHDVELDPLERDPEGGRSDADQTDKPQVGALRTGAALERALGAELLDTARGEWIERAVLVLVKRDVVVTLELLCAGRPAWSRAWFVGSVFGLLSVVLSLVGSGTVGAVAIGAAAIGVLAATPGFGGSWPGLTAAPLPHGTAHVLSLFPVSWRRTVRAMLVVNVVRAVAALPLWGILAWSIAALTGSHPEAMVAVMLCWVTCVAWLPAVTLLNSTQRGVRCARGRWWRVPAGVFVLLLWLCLAFGAFGAAVFVGLFGGHMWVVWSVLTLVMTLIGGVGMALSLRFVAGSASDHLVTPSRFS